MREKGNKKNDGPKEEERQTEKKTRNEWKMAKKVWWTEEVKLREWWNGWKGMRNWEQTGGRKSVWGKCINGQEWTNEGGNGKKDGKIPYWMRINKRWRGNKENDEPKKEETKRKTRYERKMAQKDDQWGRMNIWRKERKKKKDRKKNGRMWKKRNKMI